MSQPVSIDGTVSLSPASTDLLSNKVEYINKWGAQPDVDTADAALGQVLWPIKATVQQYVFLDTPTDALIKSTSIEDADGETGATLVRVFYQNADGIDKIIDIDPNGTVGTALPEQIVGSFRMIVLESGGAHTNVGELGIYDDPATEKYCVMVAGEGQTQVAVYRIPDNAVSAKVTSHRVAYTRSGSQNSAELRLKVRLADGTIVTKWDPSVTALLPQDIKNYIVGGIDLEPGQWVYWECAEAAANDTPLRGSFDLEIKY